MSDQVTITNLSKIFMDGKEPFQALSNINLSFKRGEFTGIVGPSGSGKSTLLNIIGSLDTPTTGQIEILGEQAENLSPKEAAWLRCEKIGFIFQTYNLLPVYTVFENVEFPLLLLGMHQKQRHECVLQALKWVNLLDKQDSRPNQLSGGQCQRVAIARAIVKQPELILADEPTANLDRQNSHSILQLMQDLNQTLGATFIFATHDEKVIRWYLTRKITLIDGSVVSDKPCTPENLIP